MCTPTEKWFWVWPTVTCAMFCTFLATSVYFWYEYGHLRPYVVVGTMISVDMCKQTCFATTPGPGGCVHAVKVTLNWVVDSRNYTESDVYGDILKCGSICCQDSIGQPVLVEIDPTLPNEALSFWRIDTVPYSISALSGAICFLILALCYCVLTCYCAMIKASERDKSNSFQLV